MLDVIQIANEKMQVELVNGSCRVKFVSVPSVNESDTLNPNPTCLLNESTLNPNLIRLLNGSPNLFIKRVNIHKLNKYTSYIS